ncbi:hypothetical protein BMS3Abin11_02494 [bacterium BMS3Abin11]|nr:hypothetical protein BMS3Abin11_02494 [bacterium BMS3Abin11]
MGVYLFVGVYLFGMGVYLFEFIFVGTPCIGSVLVVSGGIRLNRYGMMVMSRVGFVFCAGAPKKRHPHACPSGSLRCPASLNGTLRLTPKAKD